MAAGLGYIEFTTGDVLTAASANGYLASQVVMVFASASARTSAIASPQEGMMSYLKDTNSVEYYSGSAWTAVGGGGGGGGKVLQVIMGSTSTEVATSSTSFSDTGLTATITPTLSTSKILVLVAQNGGYISATNSQSAIRVRLLRGATSISQISDRAAGDAISSQRFSDTISTAYLDEPATTSATTYKTQIANWVSASEVRLQVDNGPVSTIILMEIGA
jgi:hypothetical protein